ncbi:hypothetical protein PR202_gb17691 [Eleusine coracana subsp. coracana]|uniref:Exocyst subunit Exo70 family protein n=1 Tax=Eleusine coracana subsp. coracana TaxID=191504 RepID=A0AAV5F3D7_ELECO|nr:hypothetical protein PR202_gb17691 [Eleusine coracana subsp. coracana]
MLLLLPSFSSSSATSDSDALLSRWLTGFDVAWVLDMGKGSESLPRREVGRRVRVWAQALSTMERVFRKRHRHLTDAQVACLGNLASASATAMLKLAGAVAKLRNSPSKLLALLDVYVPVSEAFPVLARMFSWCPTHPVPAAVDATLAALVDAARRCGKDLRESVRSQAQWYPWRMPQGGEVHPCVGFWMGYFRCLLRNSVTLYFVLGNEGKEEEGGLGMGLTLVPELVASLEAVLEEKAAALAFPGLRHVFMLNNTFAIVRRAVRSDLKLFLPRDWVRVREQRMEGYIKAYLEASWAPVVARLGLDTKPAAVLQRRRTSRRLSAFYSAVENACGAQRCWKVPNPVLRGILRRTVSENVVPAYRRCLEDHPEVDVAGERTAEELEQQLSDLFEG